MRKLIALSLAAVLTAMCIGGCGAVTTEDIANADQVKAESSGLEFHKIGVPTYNTEDAEVVMFKEYLEEYIKGCFEDVSFLYSESISSEEEMMDFLALCEEEDVDGILAFITYDLEAEVAFCAEREMYYIRPAGMSEDEDFAAVADNPYYVGEIGPGADLEYGEAKKMTEAMAKKGDGQSYVILTGGAPFDNEMHRLRAVAILETLEEIYGVNFESSAEELALVQETTELTAGELHVIICPGYVEIPTYGEAASAAIESGQYDVVLSTMTVTSLMDALQAVSIRCGVVDCFSEDNYFGFEKGKIAYVAGKYQSEIAPGFVALYNAITGSPELFREDGKAFRLEQGFWEADSKEMYNEMYGLSCGLAVNAYSYEDLYSVVATLNPDATFEDFKALVAAYGYEDCLARRGE